MLCMFMWWLKALKLKLGADVTSYQNILNVIKQSTVKQMLQSYTCSNDMQKILVHKSRQQNQTKYQTSA